MTGTTLQTAKVKDKLRNLPKVTHLATKERDVNLRKSDSRAQHQCKLVGLSFTHETEHQHPNQSSASNSNTPSTAMSPGKKAAEFKKQYPTCQPPGLTLTLTHYTTKLHTILSPDLRPFQKVQQALQRSPRVNRVELDQS